MTHPTTDFVSADEPAIQMLEHVEKELSNAIDDAMENSTQEMQDKLTDWLENTFVFRFNKTLHPILDNQQKSQQELTKFLDNFRQDCLQQINKLQAQNKELQIRLEKNDTIMNDSLEQIKAAVTQLITQQQKAYQYLTLPWYKKLFYKEK